MPRRLAYDQNIRRRVVFAAMAHLMEVEDVLPELVRELEEAVLWLGVVRERDVLLVDALLDHAFLPLKDADDI
eukprot:5393169-Prymnesium_polylepis.1